MVQSVLRRRDCAPHTSRLVGKGRKRNNGVSLTGLAEDAADDAIVLCQRLPSVLPAAERVNPVCAVIVFRFASSPDEALLNRESISYWAFPKGRCGCDRLQLANPRRRSWRRAAQGRTKWPGRPACGAAQMLRACDQHSAAGQPAAQEPQKAKQIAQKQTPPPAQKFLRNQGHSCAPHHAEFGKDISFRRGRVRTDRGRPAATTGAEAAAGTTRTPGQRCRHGRSGHGCTAVGTR